VRFIVSRVADDRALHDADDAVVPESREPRWALYEIAAIVNGVFSVRSSARRSGKPDELFREMLGRWPGFQVSAITRQVHDHSKHTLFGVAKNTLEARQTRKELTVV
jgi:hypothetical protein